MSELITPPLPLTVAVSPCPNDTFIFGAWVLGQCTPLPGRTASFVWEDVQVLNEAAGRKEYDVIKVSAAQALKLLDDYALLAWGYLEHYRARLDPESLSQAARLLDRAHALFSDPSGGYFLSDAKELFLRPKETYDGPIPSGNGAMALSLFIPQDISRDWGLIHCCVSLSRRKVCGKKSR